MKSVNWIQQQAVDISGEKRIDTNKQSKPEFKHIRAKKLEVLCNLHNFFTKTFWRTKNNKQTNENFQAIHVAPSWDTKAQMQIGWEFSVSINLY